KVTDNNGAIGRDTMQVTVNPQPNNIPPTANAGSNQTITLPINIVTLTGSGNDPDGNIIAYTWSKISGPAAGTISNPGNANTAVTGLVQGVYIFELKVTDDGGAIGRDSIQVTVNAAPNIPPTANAGSNQTITLPTNSVTLSGSGNDPDGSIAAYQWTKISGPVCTITNSNSALTTVTGMLQGTYLFELRVTDNSGAFGRDTVQITVNAEPNNIPPTANAGPDKTVTLPDNSATLSGSGNDADGVITRYDWRQLSGPSNNVLFSLVNAVTYINNLIHGEYEFELMVTDNRGATAIDTVKVTVTGPPQLIPLQNTIKIFPNPVIAITTLDVKSTKINTPISITIYDLQGKIVFNKFIVSGQNNFSEKIDLRNLLKGTYMVSVIFDKTEKQTLAIVKM
ncbi:MAG TPA: T9SS type A sorting domain-containing protein, partial [Ferruginibacter sp.]|nr:T9SS type A sorting domain-containing protein [Ferruginibacter sp.]